MPNDLGALIGGKNNRKEKQLFSNIVNNLFKKFNDFQSQHQNFEKTCENEKNDLKNLLQEKIQEIECLQRRNQSEFIAIKQSFSLELEKANEKVK